MPRYAQNTEVSVERSQSEIKAIVMRYGAIRYATMDDPETAMVMFEIANRRIRFELPLPDRKADKYTLRKVNQSHYTERRSDVDAYKLWEKDCRQRWRALALIVKAKLEAVETGITTIEREFMANIVLPNGQVIGDFIAPQLEAVYSTGQMPKMIPGVGETGASN